MNGSLSMRRHAPSCLGLPSSRFLLSKYPPAATAATPACAATTRTAMDAMSVLPTGRVGEGCTRFFNTPLLSLFRCVFTPFISTFSLSTMSTVSSTLVVGGVSGDSAVLTAQHGGAESFHVVRLPLSLLPPGVAVGQVIELTATRSVEAESERERDIRTIQHELRQRLGPAPIVAGASDPLAS